MDVETLKNVPLFADVPDESLAKVAIFTQLVAFHAGKTIVADGGFANDFYAIEDGEVEVSKDGEVLASLGAGDTFGEAALLEGEPRNADVIAKTSVRAIKIEHWELSRMRRAMPEVIERLKATVQARAAG